MSPNEASNEMVEKWLNYKINLRLNENELYGRRIECFIKE